MSSDSKHLHDALDAIKRLGLADSFAAGYALLQVTRAAACPDPAGTRRHLESACLVLQWEIARSHEASPCLPGCGTASMPSNDDLHAQARAKAEDEAREAEARTGQPHRVVLDTRRGWVAHPVTPVESPPSAKKPLHEGYYTSMREAELAAADLARQGRGRHVSRQTAHGWVVDLVEEPR